MQYSFYEGGINSCRWGKFFAFCYVCNLFIIVLMIFFELYLAGMDDLSLIEWCPGRGDGLRSSYIYDFNYQSDRWSNE